MAEAGRLAGKVALVTGAASGEGGDPLDEEGFFEWDERPVLILQPKPGADAIVREEMLAFLDGKIAKWWMPDEVACVAEIPLGATGKIDKRAIRIQFAHYKLPGLG
jgi:acyl-CoA synthetase (AMP-forming)/AMP-acid ligase II